MKHAALAVTVVIAAVASPLDPLAPNLASGRHLRQAVATDSRMTVEQMLDRDRSQRARDKTMIRKLSRVLKTTTLALEEKSKALAAKDQELEEKSKALATKDQELESALAVKDDEIKAQHRRQLEKDTELENLQGNLSSTKALLDKEKQASKALRERQGNSAAHCEAMLHDLHHVMDDERMMRIAAETNTSKLEVKLANLNQDKVKLNSEIAQSKESTEEKDKRIASLSSALQRAYLDVSDLRKKLDQADAEKAKKVAELEKASEEEAKELTEKLKEQAAELAKAQDELILTKSEVKDEKLRHVKAERDEQADAQAAFATVTTNYNRLRAMSMKCNNELLETRTKLENVEKVSVAYGQEILAMKASKEEMTRALGNEQMQASQFAALKEQLAPLMQNNTQLKKANEKQVTELQVALLKLQKEGKALELARHTLNETYHKLQAEDDAKRTCDLRMRHIWSVLKGKNDKLGNMEKEFKELQAASTQDSAAVQSGKEEVAHKEEDLNKRFAELQAKAAKLQGVEANAKAFHDLAEDDAKTKEDLREARAKLASTQTEEKDLAVQLAKATKNVHAEAVEAVHDDQGAVASFHGEAVEKKLKDTSTALESAEAELKTMRTKLADADAREAEEEKETSAALLARPQDLYFQVEDLQSKLRASEAREKTLESGAVNAKGGEDDKEEVTKLLDATAVEQKAILKAASAEEQMLSQSLNTKDEERTAKPPLGMIQSSTSEQADTMSLLNATFMHQMEMLRTVTAEEKKFEAALKLRR